MMRASLYRTSLRYGGGLMLHTASSGPVDGLDTLHLRLQDKVITAVGEVRINIAYLNGMAAETVESEAVGLLECVDWTKDAERLLTDLSITDGVSAPVRMLVDIALHDFLARRDGIPLAAWLGADCSGVVSYPTNQTLFISSAGRFLSQAESYVSRGFCDLKVRVGSAGFDDDVARLVALRERFGADIKLAIDANGAWSADEAAENLSALAGFELAYVEQPVAAGDWDVLNRLAETSPIPLMLDESVAGQADVDTLIRSNGRLWAHLKLVKLGGIAPTRAAADRLRAAGIPFMIGQMNEGGIATAAALHLACAVGPHFAELYGADGLENDPASGLIYAQGRVGSSAAPGLGLTFDPSKTRLIREFSA
ncbi:mandelate racemase/muconate lactonizing enzyme family protein [Candidatus Phyllobacterium onerii]|uniref:mandelate racemase/muconate lactonizing enzyme family protein n=1 Tax=Candidatus Phyllobacterium onerii TaxID=3020828 RepID=UPI00232D8772|nr:enolase C-terminal domain-like protein [Phyllobacterium sp. IY22]